MGHKPINCGDGCYHPFMVIVNIGDVLYNLGFTYIMRKRSPPSSDKTLGYRKWVASTGHGMIKLKLPGLVGVVWVRELNLRNLQLWDRYWIVRDNSGLNINNHPQSLPKYQWIHGFSRLFFGDCSSRWLLWKHRHTRKCCTDDQSGHVWKARWRGWDVPHNTGYIVILVPTKQ